MLHFTESKVFKILQIHNIVKIFFSATNECNIAKFFFFNPHVAFDPKTYESLQYVTY